jgi:hypothetical protein
MYGSASMAEQQKVPEPSASIGHHYSSQGTKQPREENQAQTTSKAAGRKLRQVPYDNVRSPDHNGKVQAYFENKTGMRRSQDKRLHDPNRSRKLKANIGGISPVKQSRFGHQRNQTNGEGLKEGLLPLIKNSSEAK